MFAILGASGKVGRATVRQLRERGAPVTAVVRDKARAGELLQWGCEIAIADLRDPAMVVVALEGATAVQVMCPVAAQSENASAEMRGIIDATCAALDFVRPAKVVAISDYGAQLGEGTGVTMMFHHLEAGLRKLSTELTLLRSAEHMENWARSIASAIGTGVLPSLHHPVAKPFPTVSAPDVGVIAADLLMAPNGSAAPRIVHVEGPRRYSAIDVATALASAVNREVVADGLPRSAWQSALVRGGLSGSYAELVAETFDAHNAGKIDVEDGAGEIRRGTTELGEVFRSLVRPDSLLTFRQ